MNLYKLSIDTSRCEKWDDFVRAFIIRATSEFQAQNIASARCYDEGPAVWLSAKCELLAENVKGDQEVILTDKHVVF